MESGYDGLAASIKKHGDVIKTQMLHEVLEICPQQSHDVVLPLQPTERIGSGHRILLHETGGDLGAGERGE